MKRMALFFWKCSYRAMKTNSEMKHIFKPLPFFVLPNLPYQLCWINKKFPCATLIPEVTYKHTTSLEDSCLPLACVSAIIHKRNKATKQERRKQYDDFMVFAVCCLKNLIFYCSLTSSHRYQPWELGSLQTKAFRHILGPGPAQL